MFVYRNSNTGQITELHHRSVRLDHLPNWLLIDASDEAPDLEPLPAAPAAAPVDVASSAPRPRRPLDTDNKAAWVTYAVARGMPEKDARALSKASLVKEFGQEDDDGES
ncbi:hypothetical protein AB0K21_22055 [Streptosporangium sp. NPDC049248]|uniref:hypothetical protein n=1 Tax=Streptosporangium sp. NPDC049248 TaxID=3155651 RepID=UPI00343D702E